MCVYEYLSRNVIDVRSDHIKSNLMFILDSISKKRIKNRQVI